MDKTSGSKAYRKSTSTFLDIYFACAPVCRHVHAFNKMGSKKVRNSELEPEAGLVSRHKHAQVELGHGSF